MQEITGYPLENFPLNLSYKFQQVGGFRSALPTLQYLYNIS